MKYYLVALVMFLLTTSSCTFVNQDAFIYACREGDWGLMEDYIQNGADVNGIGGIGLPPLQAAIFSNNIRAVKLLLDKGADSNALDQNKCSALSLAVNKGYSDIVVILLQHRADPEVPCFRTPLAEATVNSRLDIVKLLVRYGASANGQDEAYRTALMHVQDINTAKLLLKNGADKTINQRDKEGRTALFACFTVALDNPERALEIVKLLIKHGADVNIEDIRGRTILDYLLLNAEEHPEAYNGLVTFMIKNGAKKGSQIWDMDKTP
jgi:ankyrin repeat protein